MATVESELNELKIRIEQLESGLRQIARAARKVDCSRPPQLRKSGVVFDHRRWGGWRRLTPGHWAASPHTVPTMAMG
jgi:hypothetical protein